MQNNDNKVPKESVDYQNYPKDEGHHCEHCTMFREPDNCEAVTGKIDERGWCHLFAGTAGGRE